MITVKSSNYNKEDFQFILEVLKIGFTTALTECSGKCQICERRYPCQDISATTRYLEKVIEKL